MLNTMTKRNLVREGFVSFCLFQVTLHHGGKSGQEPGIRNGNRSNGEPLHIVLLLMAWPHCSIYNSGPTTAQGWQTHSGLGSYISIINHKNVLQCYPQTNLIGVYPQLMFPLSLLTLACIKQTKVCQDKKRVKSPSTFILSIGVQNRSHGSKKSSRVIHS